MNPLEWTNTVKAVVMGALTLVVQGLDVFDLYNFTQAQMAWTTSAIALVGTAFVLLTYKRSPKRTPGP